MTAKAIYLHAGPEKTGTTSIQDALYEGRETLGRLGVRYWSAAANHSWLIPLILNVTGPDEGGYAPHLTPHLTCKYGEPGSLRASLVREIDAADAKFLVSAEKVSQLSKERLRALRALLGSGGADMTAIFYVREPRGWLNSLVQQRLKEGMTIAEAVAKHRRLPYRSQIEALSEVFGESHVRLRIYRQGRDALSGLLADFFDAIDESPSLAEQFPTAWANPSMPAEAAAVLDAVSRVARAENFDSQYGWFFERFLLPNLGGTPFRLDPALLDAVVEENADQLAWLSDRLGADILAQGDAERQAGAMPQPPIGEPMARLLFALTAEILECRSHSMYQQGLRRLALEDEDGAMRAFARALTTKPDMKLAAAALTRLRKRRNAPGGPS